MEDEPKREEVELLGGPLDGYRLTVYCDRTSVKVRCACPYRGRWLVHQYDKGKGGRFRYVSTTEESP